MRYQPLLAGGMSLVLLLSAHRVAAQAKADSTTNAAIPRDTVAAQSPDTPAVATTPTDGTAPAGAADTAARRTAAASPPAPVDTVLARACSSAPVGASAPGLLAVVFKTSAADSDRVAAAREVGGKLAGGSGKEYVLIPGNSEAMRIAAARLIRLSSVSSLSEMPCPRP